MSNLESKPDKKLTDTLVVSKRETHVSTSIGNVVDKFVDENNRMIYAVEKDDGTIEFGYPENFDGVRIDMASVMLKVKGDKLKPKTNPKGGQSI